MMRILILTSLLALSGCGLAGREGPSRVVTVSWHPGAIEGRYAGLAVSGPEGSLILVSDAYGWMAVRILCHELWHAVGHYGYHNASDCVSAASPQPHPTEYFCEHEVAQMRALSGVWRLHPDPDIVDETVVAARLWNEAVGRDLFEVVYLE